ncbi:MAG: SufS family cysteine desulfurase [Thaumarchaeota archaeon]|nr:SufS family cysteine desulfurase [Candidatus Calditenuaceae archaeon]
MLPEEVKREFPIFRDPANEGLVYLDNAATTQKPERVIRAIERFYNSINANVHRGVYRLSVEATEAYESSRRKVAEFIGARSWREVVFTRGTTESINLVAFAWGLRNLRKGDRVLLTEMEHHSNIVPWQIVASLTGATVDYLPITGDGQLALDLLDSKLKGAKVFAFTGASNVLGTLNPVKELVKVASEHGALTVVDAAQYVPHASVDVSDLGCDFLAFSGHKMCGPMGIGALYGKLELLEAMEPYQGGGEMIREVRLDGSEWNEVPWKFEAGTPNVAGAFGLGEAVSYLEEFGMEQLRGHELKLTEHAMELLSSVPKLRVVGPESPEQRCGLVAFTLSDIHPHDLAEYLDARHRIAVRAGHHCAMPLHSKLGLTATTRASFYLYNSSYDVEVLVSGLRNALSYFRA